MVIPTYHNHYSHRYPNAFRNIIISYGISEVVSIALNFFYLFVDRGTECCHLILWLVDENTP